MNRNRTENGSDQLLALPPTPGAVRQLHRILVHARALLRMSRRRPTLALTLLMAGAAATTTASAIVAHVEFQTFGSLAPAPAPPAPPTTNASNAHHHHLLPAALGKINPLHGLASWYGAMWNGRRTASGETFDETKMTAAHKTLPLGTLVRVTNLVTNRSVVVKINDRGAMEPHRVIDLSGAAAREIGMMQRGLANVKLEVLGRS